ncbi:MAG: peptidoglycan-binding protein [Clostridia bacterium]|nr:peptidoglycan-binding protein [Clostridia bacterium]
MRCRLFCLLAVLVLAVSSCTPAFALEASTLKHGSRGSDVRKVQEALITLGLLKIEADGIFGNKTENAVRKFQKKNGLKVDGLVGSKTLALLLEKAAAASGSVGKEENGSASDGNLFSGDYSAIRPDDTGKRVKILQKALIELKYLSGKSDGIYGKKTQEAVLLFQQQNKLSADGIAGKKTLKALEKAIKDGAVYSAAQKEEGNAPEKASSTKAPDGSSIKLLHWFNDIKPTLKSGDHLLIYDPSTGISWTLRVYSRGRHCDSEPLTQEDTDRMVQAFGGKNTWTQKGVYVMLPSGIWTIGSTHDMPHDSGSIKDNGFNGHLCVHFLRDMDEAKKNDPKYGVANQETIRKLWKSLTGEDISY